MCAFKLQSRICKLSQYYKSTFSFNKWFLSKILFRIYFIIWLCKMLNLNTCFYLLCKTDAVGISSPLFVSPQISRHKFKFLVLGFTLTTSKRNNEKDIFHILCKTFTLENFVINIALWYLNSLWFLFNIIWKWYIQLYITNYVTAHAHELNIFRNNWYYIAIGPLSEFWM